LRSEIDLSSSFQCTEVGRAPLIDFQKWFLNKVFYRLKLFRKFKFYTCMTISGRKSVKKGQKMTKKATNLVYNAFSKFFFVLANLKYINGYNMMKKNLVSLHNFRTYFFPLGEVNASFSYLLTRANNYRRFLCDFFKQKSHLALSISMQKYAENCSFYVLKVQKI
jgi:hypothetical protein